MIRIKFKQLLEDKKFDDAKKYTLERVAELTGVSQATIGRISKNPTYITTTDVIDKLCKFFNCQPGDLLSYIPNKDQDLNLEDDAKL